MAEPTEEPPAEAAVVTFAIVPEESEARFSIDEELFGSPKTVIGITSLVDGAITIDLGDYSQTSVGAIQINADDLTTDNNFRNGALRDRILNTGDYPFIVFTPTAIEGLPDTVAMGEPFTFSITGDLTIREITNPVTFQVTVTPVSETEISGSAVAQVLRADYDLTIPQVPNVANVSEEVGVEFDFVARAGQ